MTNATQNIRATLFIDGEEYASVYAEEREHFEELLLSAAKEWAKLGGFHVIREQIQRADGKWIFAAVRA